MVKDPPRFVARSKAAPPALATTASATGWEKFAVVGIPAAILVAAIATGAIVLPRHYRNKELDAQIAKLPQTRVRQVLGEMAWRRESLAKEDVRQAEETVAWRKQALNHTRQGYLDEAVARAQRDLEYYQGKLSERRAADSPKRADIDTASGQVREARADLDFLQEKRRQFESGALSEESARRRLELGQEELAGSQERLKSVQEESRALAREYARLHQEEMSRVPTRQEAIRAATALLAEARSKVAAKQTLLNKMAGNPTDHSPDEIAKARASLGWANEAYRMREAELNKVRKAYSGD